MKDELALIALGSNLGDPLAQLRSARAELEARGSVHSASRLYRTEPVGGPPGQPAYLNAVLVLRPSEPFREPLVLLRELLSIESRHGRRRRIAWEARTLDLDLLAFGERSMDLPQLVLPHPRMLQRAFVLAPLCDALPAWRHPVTGRHACEVLKELPQTGIAPTELEWNPR